MNRKISGIFAVSALLVASLFLSWRGKPDKSDTFSEKDFAKPVNLKGSALQVDAMIMKPIGINVIDNLLFLTNSGTEYIFEVYIDPRIINLTKDSIWISDRQSWLLRKYRTKDFISGPKPECVQKIKLGHIYSKTTVLSNNRIVASSSKSEDKKFDYYDLNAKLLESKGEYTEKSLSAMDNKMFYKFGYTAGANDRIFACYTFGDIIEIYDGATGDLIKRRYGPNKNKPRPEVKDRKIDGTAVKSIKSVGPGSGNIAYHTAPVTAGNEVFVVYVGAPYEKTVRGQWNRMFVFDLEGNPLRIYNLDIPIGYYAVDAEKRIIYGITDISDLNLPNAQSDYNIIVYEY
jgi:hypothetical protein